MIWTVIKAWLGKQLDVLLVVALVALSAYCAQVLIERHVAQRRLDKTTAALAALQAEAERAAREESERRRSTEEHAETANVSLVHQHAADAVADLDHRSAVAARLRQRAVEARAVSAAAASAPAGTCTGMDVPPVAGLPDESRGRLVDLATSAVATGRALDACRRYVVDVVLPACAPGTLMDGGR